MSRSNVLTRTHPWRALVLATAATLALVAATPAMAETAGPPGAPAEEARALLAVDVLNEMQSLPELRIPEVLLRRAQGIAIIPDMARGALLLGGRGGKGVVLVRNAQGQWSNPAFITVGGVSFGWQFGAQTVDMVLVFTTRQSIEGVTGGKLTLARQRPVRRHSAGRWHHQHRPQSERSLLPKARRTRLRDLCRWCATAALQRSAGNHRCQPSH
jgi:hypothetical protein